MIYLHYDFFTQIKWLEVLKASAVMIVVPPVTIRELNKHKGRQRLKRRADKVIKKLASLFRSDIQTTIGDGVEMRLEDREPMINFAEFELDQADKDDRLIASIIMFRKEEPEAELILITADEGLTLKAKAKRLNIPTIMMPDNLRLPEKPDPNESRIKELEQKVLALNKKMPDISLVFADGNQHATFALPHPFELTPEEIASKQKLLEQQYPKMEQETKQSRLSPENFASFGSFAEHMLMTLLPEDINKYNKELDDFYQAYSDYLKRNLSYENLKRRTIELSIFAANDGSTPAEDVDVFLNFPNGFKLTASGLPNAPKTPEIPAKPLTKWEKLIELSKSGPIISMPQLIRGIPIPRTVVSSQNISAPNIRNTFSYDVDFNIQKLKHNRQEPTEILYVIFESFKNARSFHINYRLLADNIPNEVRGQLHIIIEKN